MNETPAIAPCVRATAVFESEPRPTLRCSHCESEITDDDAECPTCDSPIDWGASFRALERVAGQRRLTRRQSSRSCERRNRVLAMRNTPASIAARPRNTPTTINA